MAMTDTTVGLRIVALAAAKPDLPKERAALAAAFGVSYETLRKWMSGATAPNRSRAKVIADLLGVPVETLMHGVVVGPDGVGSPPAQAQLSPDERLMLGAYRRILRADRERVLAELQARCAELQAIAAEIVTAPPAAPLPPEPKPVDAPPAKRPEGKRPGSGGYH